jgi:hypothetical protein
LVGFSAFGKLLSLNAPATAYPVDFPALVSGGSAFGSCLVKDLVLVGFSALGKLLSLNAPATAYPVYFPTLVSGGSAFTS